MSREVERRREAWMGVRRGRSSVGTDGEGAEPSVGVLGMLGEAGVMAEGKMLMWRGLFWRVLAAGRI
jgi:hypothetical protein